jgi:Nickel responsive protein SCO4226-like
VPEYLVELYSAAGPDSAALAALGGGTPVRYLRSIVIPGDETCLHLVVADSIEQVARACEQAGLHADRIVEAIGLQPPMAADNDDLGGRP